MKKMKGFQNLILAPGIAGASLEGYQGIWSRRRRVGRVEVASLARGGSGSDRRAGSSPYVAPVYDKLIFTEGSRTGTGPDRNRTGTGTGPEPDRNRTGTGTGTGPEPEPDREKEQGMLAPGAAPAAV